MQRELAAASADLLQALLYNTPSSGNFSALVRVFCRYKKELAESVKCGK